MEVAPVRYIVTGSYFNDKDVEIKFQKTARGGYDQYTVLIDDFKNKHVDFISINVCGYSTSTYKHLWEETVSGPGWSKWLEKREKLSFKEKYGFDEPVFKENYGFKASA